MFTSVQHHLLVQSLQTDITDLSSWDADTWLALVALLVSIAFGLFNLLYTRRKFILANYPKVKAVLTLDRFQGPRESTIEYHAHYPLVRITNPSETVSISDLSISISFANPLWRIWRIGQKRRISYAAERLESLDTQRSHNEGEVAIWGSALYWDGKQPFEVLLGSAISNLFEWIRLKRSIGRSVEDIFFKPNFEKPLNLRLSISYLPIAMYSRTCRLIEEYELIPVLFGEGAAQELKGMALHHWRIDKTKTKERV